MKPKHRTIIEEAISNGISRGYYRAFKHDENPSPEAIIENIEEAVWGSLYEYYSFDDED
jgi:hypothetical protein